MSHFRARYPTINELQGMEFQISEIGNFRLCKFYTSSHEHEDDGIAFRAAYDDATQSSNHKELCAYVGSMLCAVSNDLKTSVVEALFGAGIQIRFVQLPSQARENDIDEAQVSEMDWPSILVHFGCICIILFIKKNSEASYKSFMSNCICELQKRVGIEPGIGNVSLDFSRANAVRTMLGASLTLRETLIKFIMGTMNQGHTRMHSVCQYLFNVLSWSGMDALILMNEVLVIPQSSILRDPLLSREVENLREACGAIEAHPFPQFFMHLASNVDLLNVDHSRFPALIDIALEKKLERDELIDKLQQNCRTE